MTCLLPSPTVAVTRALKVPVVQFVVSGAVIPGPLILTVKPVSQVPETVNVGATYEFAAGDVINTAGAVLSLKNERLSEPVFPARSF